MNRVLQAFRLASELHHGQFREPLSNAEPYILHPIAVAQLLQSAGYDEDRIILALLHDVIEDGLLARDVSDRAQEERDLFDRIMQDFGSTIAFGVQELTDDWRISKADRRKHQLEHRYSALVAPVKIADKTCNVLDLARTRAKRDVEAASYLARARQVVETSCAIHKHASLSLHDAWYGAADLLQSALRSY